LREWRERRVRRPTAVPPLLVVTVGSAGDHLCEKIQPPDATRGRLLQQNRPAADIGPLELIPRLGTNLQWCGTEATAECSVEIREVLQTRSKATYRAQGQARISEHPVGAQSALRVRSAPANFVRNSLESRRNRDRAARPFTGRKRCSLGCPAQIKTLLGKDSRAVLPSGRSAWARRLFLAWIVLSR
jgi:hypothetical protein